MSSSTVGVGDDDLVTGEAVALELPAAGVAVHAVSRVPIDVVATLLLLWAANARRRRRDRRLRRGPRLDRDAAGHRPRAARAADDAGDADPRPVARQAGPRAAHRARRRGPDRLPARLHPRARGRGGDLAAVRDPRRSSAVWSAPRASGSATTRPAPTSSASGCDDASRPRRRCHRRWPAGPSAPTSPGCPTAWRWRCASSSAGPRASAPPPGPRSAPSCRPRCCATSPRPRRPAATPRWCWRPSSPTGGAATASGCSARPRCGRGCCRADPLAPAAGPPPPTRWLRAAGRPRSRAHRFHGRRVTRSG